MKIVFGIDKAVQLVLYRIRNNVIPSASWQLNLSADIYEWLIKSDSHHQQCHTKITLFDHH